ncbi:MAG: winged helix-turn-helix transcriptional regulator, partial [bacterium]|nr:winged helix-turn-helix transcriptional regulator [bacterium]
SEFDEICSLTNPTVKKALLKSFADDCDSAAVHLQAAALPRQKYQVILPITSIKDNEVYAPNYKNGETVALIRYPHGGTFEIPILTVNNKQPEAKKVLGTTPKDAIGINSKVAERLSGADFDGDTVMVIPCNSPGSKIKITSTQPLKGLEGFDPKAEYPEKKGMKYMKNTQTEMGKISNLITDMTLKGATDEEKARAVRHSMVVIDAEKHKLDYKQSEIDNGIASLKKKYQGRVDEDGRYHEGASTLISRSKSEVSVIKRKGSPVIDPETGKQSWKTVDDPVYVDKKTGKIKTRTQPSTAMAETDDARKLSSGHPIEEAYADYANQMKGLANRARKEMMSTGKIAYSASAKRVYQNEVDSLNAKLNLANSNAPKERRAQVMANAKIASMKKDYPDMTKAEIKKASQRALTQARTSVGAHREPIKFTDREWEAVQAGAISPSKLEQIITKADSDDLKQRATPRTTTQLSSAKISKINAMKNSGYSTSEIADALGISSSTVSKYLK